MPHPNVPVTTPRTRATCPIRTATLSLIAAACMLCLHACDDAPTPPAPSDAKPVTSDATGTVKQEHPARIAVLLPFAADQLLAIGVRPVAVPLLAGEVPEAWQGIQTVAVDHSAGPNLEQLIAADPDIVISGSVYTQFLPMIALSTGARIVTMDVDSIADVAEHITTLGELSGATEEANRRVEDLRSILAQPQTDETPVKVLAVFGTPHAFYAFLPDSYLGDLVEHAGGVMITSDMESHSVFRGLAPLSMEVILDRDPDQLLVVFHGPEASARAMLDRDPLWSQLSAVRNDAIAFLTDDLYAMRPGSELDRAMAGITAIMDQARARRP